jgi:hypothetical protein
MKFVGNYANWIDAEHLRQLVINSVGQARPRDWPASSAIESAEYKKYNEAGYNLSAINWWVYEKDDLDIDISPPWTTGTVHWWVTKLYPGQYMPMHTDPDTHGKECNRFWVPLQDYHPGHIFIYNDELIVDYKAGDVYTYFNSTDLHGAANIGHIPRVVLQVTEYL